MLAGDKVVLGHLPRHVDSPRPGGAAPRGAITLRPSRGALLLGVIGLHAGVLYLGLHLAMRRADVPELPPIQVTMLSAAVPQTAPQMPAPSLARVDVNVPPPDVEVAVEAPTAITVPVRAPAAAPASAQQPAPAAPAVISQVAYVTPPQPHYPADSRRAHEQGTVLVRVLIDETGRAHTIEIERSSGHPRLDAAALEAVSHAVFRPYVEGGVARVALAIVPIEFVLSR